MDYRELLPAVVAVAVVLFVAALLMRGRPWPLWTGPPLGAILLLVDLGILRPMGRVSEFDMDRLVDRFSWEYLAAMLAAGTLSILLIRLAWPFVPQDVLDRFGPAGRTASKAGEGPEA